MTTERPALSTRLAWHWSTQRRRAGLHSTVTYDWSANGQHANFTSFNVGGITVSETTTTNFSGGSTNNFTTSTETDGGQTGFYRLYMAPENIADPDLDPENMGQLLTFSFSETVQDLQFSLTDSDWTDNDYEDILRVEATGPSSGFVRYARSTPAGAPSFSFAGDLLEGDTANDNATNGSTSTWASSIADSNTTSMVYLAGNEIAGTGEPNDQLVTITDFSFCAFDFGDAPDTYGTTLGAGGAQHVLASRELWMGVNRTDGETTIDVANPAATADDIAAIGGINDGDGVTTFLPSLMPAHLGPTRSLRAHRTCRLRARTARLSASSTGTATVTSPTATRCRRRRR